MSSCIIDPNQELPAIEWSTREQLFALGAAFCRLKGNRYILSVRRLGGRRTCAKQREIYLQGRTVPGQIVTYADGCQSWHVAGRAVDLEVIDAATGLSAPESLYGELGALWQRQGGVWGGTFPGFVDYVHFEWHPGLRIEDVCPVPAACQDTAVDTLGPGALAWAAAGTVVAATAAWLFWDDLSALAQKRLGAS